MMATRSPTTYEAVEWLSGADRLRYADYWNDEEEERRKPFWVLDGDFSRMEAYLTEIGLPAQMEESVRVARVRFGRGLGGVGVDLGAGTLWAVPYLFRLGTVDHVYCVEYSRHRLLKLGPAVLEHYGVSSDRVTLALGDIHRLRLADHSVDFVFLSAAFHHSDTPGALLSEIRRVLRPSGLVIVTGEHMTDGSRPDRLRHMAKFVASRMLPDAIQQRLFGRSLQVARLMRRDEDLLPGDDRLGDHEYTLAQYEQLFSTGGFVSQNVRRDGWAFQAFVLIPGGDSAS